MTIKGNRVEGIEEKPRMAVDISAGIQVIDPLVREYIPEEEPLDMPSLIWKVISGQHRVTAYRFSGPWHDIGNPESFRRAAHEFEHNPERYVPASTSPREPAMRPMGARHT
jgi:NDP-sugar pyrophosphorylase family protein